MPKVRLSLDELAVESFSVEAEAGVGTVYAAEAPTARTMQCPCYESISCFAC